MWVAQVQTIRLRCRWPWGCRGAVARWTQSTAAACITFEALRHCRFVAVVAMLDRCLAAYASARTSNQRGSTAPSRMQAATPMAIAPAGISLPVETIAPTPRNEDDRARKDGAFGNDVIEFEGMPRTS
jgi:hypothetical protein